MTDRLPAHFPSYPLRFPRRSDHSPHDTRRRCRLSGWQTAKPMITLMSLVVASWLLGSTSTWAQSGAEGTAAETSAFTVGINGHYRVGRLTAVRVEPSLLEETGESKSSGRLRLETTDGDGVRVAYDPFPFQSPDAKGRELGYVVPGSEAAPLALLFADGSEPSAQGIDGEVSKLGSARFPLKGNPSQGPSMISSATPWIVAIGDSLGVDSIGASSILLDKEARLAVTQIDAASSLPHHAFGYDGVDLVMITASGVPVLEQMVDEQRAALSNWLRGGGRMFVCLGRSTQRVIEAAPWLKDSLPIDDIEVSRYDPAAFEMFASSQNRLNEFRGIKLPKRTGRILVSGRTTRRVTAIQAAEYIAGFGRITIVSADLDGEDFAEWPERLRFVTQIVGDLFEDENNKERSDVSTAFGDLAGQMRGTLDQFDIKAQFSFSMVSLIVMLLIAAIGPLDYLLINRVWGKPLLGWLTFPLVAIALSVVLVIQARPRESSAVGPGEVADAMEDQLLRANQFQVTDIDLVNQVGRGFAWCSIYSHEPARLDVRFAFDPKGAENSDANQRGFQSFSFPMGYPGRDFGGLQLASENSVFPDYFIAPARDDSVSDAPIESPISGVTVAPRSSKSLATRILFRPDFDREYSLTRRPGSELLRGEFTNPLPYDLLDGMIIYGNWAYILPTRVPAGATIAQLNEVLQKNFRWRLTGQQMGDSVSTESFAWSPGNFGDIRRVADMMLFYKAAGGEIYTGLRHNPLGHLDLSPVLDEDRCVLVGRTESPLFDLQIRETSGDGAETVGSETGNTLSVVRVILPVRSTRLN